MAVPRKFVENRAGTTMTRLASSWAASSVAFSLVAPPKKLRERRVQHACPLDGAQRCWRRRSGLLETAFWGAPTILLPEPTLALCGSIENEYGATLSVVEDGSIKRGR